MKTLQTLFPLIISNTDMELWSHCELKWFRERCQHLSKPGFNINLKAGGSFASGLETVRKLYFNEGYSSEDAVEIGSQTCIDLLQKQIELSLIEVPYSDRNFLKNPQRMGLAVKQYFRKFPLEDEEIVPAILEDGTRAFEHKLTIELPILHPELEVPLIFKGILDLIQKDRYGRTYIVDDKTASAIYANTGEVIIASGQQIGYAFLARENGIKVNECQIRKVAILANEIKIPEPYLIPITPFILEKWLVGFISKVNTMVEKYKLYKESQLRGTENIETNYFFPDYYVGCSVYNQPCMFIGSCTSKGEYESLLDIADDGLGRSDFQQTCYNKENKERVSLQEYRNLLGLGK